MGDGSIYFRIHPQSGVPIYRQLMDQILQHLAGGSFKAGDLLPSVRQIAEDLQINPMTVSKAYSLLERDGVLERMRGQGMRIAGPTKPAPLKERQEQIRPLMRQLASEAYRLALTRRQVHQLLDPLLKELPDE